MDPVGAGDDVPDGLVMPDPDAGGPAAPRVVRLGFPKRSTPSFAAEIIAEPSMEASKRDGMADVALPSPRP